jgi:hypothetical protein
MKGTHLTVGLALGLAALWLASGCAQFPANVVIGGRRLLTMQLTLRGAADPNAYYLFVIDTGTSGDGPRVLAPLTPFLGNGRATGSYTHYVEYHQGRFELFRDQPEQVGVSQPPRVALGQPFSYNDSSSSGTLRCALDLAQLKTNTSDPDPQQIKLNLITVNEIVLPGDVPPVPRQTDGFGPDGNSYLIVRLLNGVRIDNSTLIEGSSESYEGRPLDAAYDLVDFAVEVGQGG